MGTKQSVRASSMLAALLIAPSALIHAAQMSRTDAAQVQQPASAPADTDTAQTRQALEALKADPELVQFAPEAVAAAERAVAAAERPQPNSATAAYTAFVAAKKVQIAALETAARRDDHIRGALSARLDAVRHGNDSITTIAGDAVGVTPPKLQLTPIAPTPVPAPLPALPAAATPETASQAALSPKPLSGPRPLLALDSRDFDKAGVLSPAARRAISRLLPALLADLPPQPIVIATAAGNDKTSERRAYAVKNYLLGEGMPAWRLVVRSIPDPGTVPAGGVALFGRAAKTG